MIPSRYCQALSVALLVSWLASCGHPAPAAPPKEYSLTGEVLRLDPQVRTVVIKHQKIEGWMEAMTMEFPVREAKEFEKLAVGKHITASVYVTDESYWLAKIAEKPEAPAPATK